MLPEWRLLYDGIHEAQHHFAMEEALARLVDEGKSPPTLRMRQVTPSVFVGVYQNTWSEVDVAYCQSHNVQIVRRSNGGGAVYHEMGSFCFSAFFRRNLLPLSEQDLYRLFAIPVIRTCADYGLDASFHGRNDVLVGGRKIYGSAQFAMYDAFVQSGTFLVNMDFEAMERALTPPTLKFEGKSAGSIHERVTSLSREVGRELETREVMDCFAGHVADMLEVKLIPGNLTFDETALAAELLAVKYSTDKWNFGSRPEYQVTIADRTDEGVISLSANMEGEKIRKIRINGDLLISDQSQLDNLQHSLVDCSLQEARHAVQASSLSDAIQDSLIRLLAKLAREIADISSGKSKEDQI